MLCCNIIFSLKHSFSFRSALVSIFKQRFISLHVMDDIYSIYTRIELTITYFPVVVPELTRSSEHVDTLE